MSYKGFKILKCCHEKWQILSSDNVLLRKWYATFLKSFVIWNICGLNQCILKGISLLDALLSSHRWMWETFHIKFVRHTGWFCLHVHTKKLSVNWFEIQCRVPSFKSICLCYCFIILFRHSKSSIISAQFYKFQNRLPIVENVIPI